MSTLSIMAGKDSQNRSEALRHEQDEWIVDTVVPFDTGVWETGISQNSGHNWIIVEQYESKAEAKEGHEKWVNSMKKNPKQEHSDIKVWEP